MHRAVRISSLVEEGAARRRIAAAQAEPVGAAADLEGRLLRVDACLTALERLHLGVIDARDALGIALARGEGGLQLRSTRVRIGRVARARVELLERSVLAALP